MTNALFYPNMEIHNEDILKMSLLMWDTIECIVPFNQFDYWGPDEFREAHELVVRSNVPNKSQQEKAHELILELATSPIPERYLISDIDAQKPEFKFYPQKLLPATFEALSETNMAKAVKDKWYLPDAIGLTVMSILADVCSGSERRKITDADTAHSALLKSISGVYGGEDCSVSDPQDRLINIAVDIVDPNSISLVKLVDFRNREIGSSEGRHLRRLRHNFSSKIDEFANRSVIMISEGQSEEDISRTFQDELRDDLMDLKEALKLNRNDLFTSRPFIVAVGAAATSMIPAVGLAANAVTAVSLAGTIRKYNQDKRNALENHSISWLYRLNETELIDYAYRIGPIPAIG